MQKRIAVVAAFTVLVAAAVLTLLLLPPEKPDATAGDVLLTTTMAENFTWTIWGVIAPITNAESILVLPPNSTTNMTMYNATVIGTVVFNESLYDQGWDLFQVTPGASAANWNMSDYYVAGYGEGYVTHDRLTLIFNAQGTYTLSPKAQTWVEAHVVYMQNQTLLNNESTFWVQLGNLFSLMQGIADGYTARSADLGPGNGGALTLMDIFRMNFVNEYSDVETAVNGTASVEEDENPVAVLRRRRSAAAAASSRTLFRDQHCSALVKVTPEDIFFSHDTWDSFENTIRMYKTYAMPEATVSFSGMAGMIASGDDWYMTSNLLAVQETTNSVYNTTLYRLYTVPETVSEFLRVMVANYVAVGGMDWVGYFQTNNSGTYSNQWMVLDYNQYTPGATGAALGDGLLWVAEQIPGNVTSADVTQILRDQSYWPSYNTPYFPNIFNESGYPALEKAFGPFFSYANYSRAEIFRRNESDVTDLASMQAMMRFNDWTTDPLCIIPNCANCTPPTSPMLGIASRGDLVPIDAILPADPTYGQYFGRGAFGAVDCKITNYALIQQMQGIVINGPTTYNGNPIFSWSGAYAGQQPIGAPHAYNFTWQWYNAVVAPTPPHGYYDGLSHTTTVVLAAIGGALCLVLVFAGVVMYMQKRNVVQDKYQPLA